MDATRSVDATELAPAAWPAMLAPAPAASDEGVAEAREGEHAERDACGHAVEDRRALAQPDLAAAHVRHDRPEELRAAGGPGHPGGQDEDAQGRLRERPPGVPEAAGQRIADDHDEHGRHGREGEEGGAGGADDVEDPLRPTAPGALATGGADGDGVGQRGRLRRRLADRGQATPAGVGQGRGHGGRPAHALRLRSGS